MTAGKSGDGGLGLMIRRRYGTPPELSSIKLLVELCQDLGASMDAAMQSLRDKKDMTMEEAQKKVEIYWKEPTDIPEKKNSPNG